MYVANDSGSHLRWDPTSLDATDVYGGTPITDVYGGNCETNKTHAVECRCEVRN